MKAKRILYYIFPLLILINSVMSVGQGSKIPLNNTFLSWIINFSIIGICVWYYRKYFCPSNRRDYRIVFIYFIWLVINVIRGLFVPDNYWEWKQLISGTTSLALPVLVFIFSNPHILKRCLSVWIRYGMMMFVFLIWVIKPEAYQSFLGPIFFLASFLPIVPRKWRLVLVGFLVLLIFVDFGARSQVLKALMALFLSLSFILAKYLFPKILEFIHWLFYLCAVSLLVVGVLGIFNPFESLSKNEGKYVETTTKNGTLVEDDLASDTRSFIYTEVIASALKHNYVIWGRTPARGNDSESFGANNAEDLKTGKYERHKNEVCFPNIFTWLGLVGMLLYCFIYLKSTFLAIYRSRNIFLKIIGVSIAFHFTYGWVEDVNDFNILSITLWMMIGMAFSQSFRQMSNEEFKRWMNQLFVR